MPAVARAYQRPPLESEKPPEVSVARHLTRSGDAAPAGPPTGDGVCPVAALAAEAAAARRLMLRLRENSPHADAELIARLLAGDDTVSIEELRDACFKRLAAVTAVASHRRARSVKGAIFQFYVMADRLSGLDDVLPLSKLTRREQDEFEEWRAEVRRLAYSAAACLEETDVDDDLRLLREWTLAPKYDVLAELHQLMGATPQ